MITRLEYLAQMRDRRLVSFDTETRLFIKRVMMTPRIVCGSFCDYWITPGDHTYNFDPRLIVGADAVCDRVELLLSDKKNALVLANAAYDFGCVAAERADLLPLIFEAYEDGRVYDVLIAANLSLIADGMLGYDPATGFKEVEDDEGETRSARRMSLDLATEIFLGRKDAKARDYWRCRYGILESVPFEDWPADARQYPLDDAQNTLQVAIEQLNRYAGDKIKNLHDVPAQCRADFALHLASIRGLRTDKARIDEIEKQAQTRLAADIEKFKDTGFLKWPDKKAKKQEWKTDTANVKRAVVLAYGADASVECPLCLGSGKVRSAKTGNAIGCKAKDGGCDGTGYAITDDLPIPRTETGGVSASRDTLKESGDDLLIDFGGVSEIRKIIQTYLPYLREGEGAPIYTSMNVLGAATGRVSCDGLLMLLPKGFHIRNAFVARQQHVFNSIDYSALELCTLAQVLYWLFGENALQHALNNDLDPHCWLAAAVCGKPYEEVYALYKAGDPYMTALRNACKSSNFGFGGGMGVPKFIMLARKIGLRFCVSVGGAERCGVEKVTRFGKRFIPPTCAQCLEIAASLRKAWFAAWPEMQSYFSWVTSQVDNTGAIEQWVSERLRGGLDFCSGANTSFQGLAADGAKAALFAVSREAHCDRSSPLFGSRPVAFIHDEIILEHEETTAHLAAPRAADIMRAQMQRYVPDVLIKCEPALMRSWDKEAKTVYDASGKLIPFEDARKA